jgi:C4-dicarboxylate transporter/malic acid transport protein
MSTGGIALLLYTTPHSFKGLNVIGRVVFILDLFLFASICIGITVRFVTVSGSLLKSLQHPTESLFFPTFWLSIAVIISNIHNYGLPYAGEWLKTVLMVLFWIYSALTFLVAVGQYHLLFTGKPLTAQSMTPAWILPVFPVMLSGTMASVIAPSLTARQALPIIVAGLTFQGLGFMVSIFMYSNYLGRLMTAGLPSPDTRPGMFIAVGPPSFTALTVLGLAGATNGVYPPYELDGVTSTALIPQVAKIVALSIAIFLWSLSLWFFAISLVSVLNAIKTMSFHLSWWSFVFPNVGFIIAAIEIGKTLESSTILWVTSGMTIALVALWLFVGICQVRAVWTKKIMWPGMDEDFGE